tara:strand:- start:105 stop:422 length:318 start_codon:yes stop_codon:yes gene_type:complete
MKLIISLLIISIYFTADSISNEKILKRGEQIFYGKSSCSNCHMLNAADGSKKDMNVKRVIEVVTHGYGVMPAYKDVLSKDDINAVATYISKVSKSWKNKLSSFVQ